MRIGTIINAILAAVIVTVYFSMDSLEMAATTVTSIFS
jgi:hypothetical protein